MPGRLAERPKMTRGSIAVPWNIRWLKVLRELSTAFANPSAVSGQRVGWRSARHEGTRPEENGLALVEAALCLHNRALGAGVRPTLARSVVAPCLIVLTGHPDDVAHAEPSDLDLVLRPGRENGWRSESDVRSKTGRVVRVEAIAPHGPPTSHNVTSLCGPGGPASDPADTPVGRHAARTAALHRLGQVDRAHSDRQRLEAGPILTLLMSRSPATRAPSALAALWSYLMDAEAAFQMPVRFPPAPFLRRLHVFDPIDMGTAFTISNELFRGPVQAPSSQSLRSCIRRVPDGATLAVCETVLR